MTVTRRARWGALAVAATVGLGACATPGATTAFEVDGETVTMQQLDTWTKACASASSPEATQTQRVEGVRNLALQGLIGKQLARDLNVTVTDEQARGAVLASGAGAGLNDPDCAELMMGFGRFYAVANKVQPERAMKAVSGLDITVNPRIGGWDKQNLTLVHTSGTLSQVAPQTRDATVTVPGR